MKQAFIVLLLVLLGGWVLWQAAQPSRAPQTMPQWPGIDVRKVQDVRIMTGEAEQIHLQKRDDGWVIVGGKAEAADDQAVQRLLDDLATMQPIRIVTRNKAHYDRLQVGDTGQKLVLRNDVGDTVFAARIGKQGSDLISTYVRLADHSEAFAVDRSLVWQVKRSVQGWKAAESKADSDPRADPQDQNHTEGISPADR
ncbi:MAG: DUF4340 domain-containing protein [Mariprofundaceae bacterium]